MTLSLIRPTLNTTFSLTLVDQIPPTTLFTRFTYFIVPTLHVEMQSRTLLRPLSPNINLDQTWISGIIGGIGVPPMFGYVNIATLNRIVMDVIEFFPHDAVTKNKFGMNAFQPKLVFTVILAGKFGKPQRFLTAFPLFWP